MRTNKFAIPTNEFVGWGVGFKDNKVSMPGLHLQKSTSEQLLNYAPRSSSRVSIFFALFSSIDVNSFTLYALS